ncbi:hypothetical protein M2451_003748 [Dysgonomonas sp. PFB1-18]|uniref:RagB/SusD family nutrient uptake outer membrane protein n=1 Tax=unclassified Dysgonomonas TaxID=2630389 RepID=UPI002473DF2F|nr:MULTISPECIES: RagB/SusD family nutrient uptake outer membrane protein [unclassified Dysgonomonas]MDH6310978.1 hypothetical protein [Dysgonomonas sp. PF1-14]MDH6340807.1 hypothetical protein [Dysgonomonas sp. PF1-16]MDH6382407.1 hypothetical protein [Dysgonomonas sp. PFB1-18]MDH6399776.1 hypothetical protein [Dysgonomonas sp. PF1-23]
MKNNIIIYLLFLIASFSFASCSVEGDSILDKAESGELNEDKVFSNAQNTKQFLTNIYINLPYGWDQQYWIDGVTDDGEHRPFNTWSKNIVLGSYGATNLPNQFDRWTKYYEMIRACNKFIEKVDQSPIDLESYTKTEAIRTRMKYEAICLRAYYYAELLRWVGGVPIITEVLDVDSPELYSPRANLQEMRDFIISECDLAAANLPAYPTESIDFGRVTKAVALAIKSRVLLQLASPLFNSDVDAYGNKTELCAWSWGNYDAKRWEDAAKAAEEFMAVRKEDGSSYGLHTNTTKPSNWGKSSFTCLASQNSLGFYWVFIERLNPEVILCYSKKGGSTNEVTKWSVPHSMQKEQTQAGATLPTMNFVGSFETRNGIKIYETNEDGSYKTDANGEFIVRQAAKDDGFDPQDPYKNRDNRFYHCVYYNTQKANGVEFEIWRTETDPIVYGREYNETYNHTGFFNRKFNDPFKVFPKTDRVSTISGTSTSAFPLIRYVEMLLNYAEAQNEFLADGADRSSVIARLDLIRSRADMPDVKTTFQRNGWSVNNKQQMREFIRNERRIELAFEIHRIHDVRRWKIGESTQKIIYQQDIVKDRANDKYTYYIKIWKNRVFMPKHYIQPIPYSEVKNNPNMVQNPGW